MMYLLFQYFHFSHVSIERLYIVLCSNEEGIRFLHISVGEDTVIEQKDGAYILYISTF